MNRKNLTAAVLAGLAGAAGLAGTAQAVNLNPDGLGQVLIYPYYTSNGGNATLLSVVNTTGNAKAVKVRFLEGFNSREVLDFNLYLSEYDVWVAGILADFPNSPDYTPSEWDTSTSLVITDDSCTVPYLYADYPYELDSGLMAGVQPFRDYAYSEFPDGGPTDEGRAAEGHFEIIEMGTITPDSDTEDDITHQWHTPKDADKYWAPGDCEQLVENWSYGGSSEDDGMWVEEALSIEGGLGQAWTDTMRNSGGLFGGAAVINVLNGAMFSYDAKAVQGFDKTDDGMHYIPGNEKPSLNSGNQTEAYVFFGVPQNKSVKLTYPMGFGVGAVSAVFMHEFTMNEYTTADSPAEAATEWVVTFPTKSFYVDPLVLGDEAFVYYAPFAIEKADGTYKGVPDCNFWVPGNTYPMTTAPDTDTPITEPGKYNNPGWENCEYVAYYDLDDPTHARAPFTELFDGGACEAVTLVTYDRDERTYLTPGFPGRPPVVSPAPPPIPGVPDIAFELCNETNVLRFGERSIFDTPAFGDQSLLITVDDEFTEGWGWINYFADKDHVDQAGLVGLPVTGFAAQQYENGFLQNDDGQVKAFYGGLFQHKGNVRKVKVKKIN